MMNSSAAGSERCAFLATSCLALIGSINGELTAFRSVLYRLASPLGPWGGLEGGLSGLMGCAIGVS